ncbi:hypothetical protein BaRGS_00037630 [Batillaria attramentaria]|uniref:Uncharacterized protein n=1 Tax=Batillaria attramentaria TaxID=370345 RepID=A0ABD0J8Z1_9CAEN
MYTDATGVLVAPCDKSSTREENGKSDDVGSLQPVINHMTQQLNEVTADVQALKNANVLNEQARGSAYVRWGSNGCPNSSELVYSGA